MWRHTVSCSKLGQRLKERRDHQRLTSSGEPRESRWMMSDDSGMVRRKSGEATLLNHKGIDKSLLQTWRWLALELWATAGLEKRDDVVSFPGIEDESWSGVHRWLKLLAAWLKWHFHDLACISVTTSRRMSREWSADVGSHWNNWTKLLWRVCACWQCYPGRCRGHGSYWPGW